MLKIRSYGVPAHAPHLDEDVERLPQVDDWRPIELMVAGLGTTVEKLRVLRVETSDPDVIRVWWSLAPLYEPPETATEHPPPRRAVRLR